MIIPGENLLHPYNVEYFAFMQRWIDIGFLNLDIAMQLGFLDFSSSAADENLQKWSKWIRQ